MLPLMKCNHWHFSSNVSLSPDLVFSTSALTPSSSQPLPGAPRLPSQHFTLNSLNISIVFSYAYVYLKNETILHTHMEWFFHLGIHTVYLQCLYIIFYSITKVCHNLKLKSQDWTFRFLGGLFLFCLGGFCFYSKHCYSKYP